MCNPLAIGAALTVASVAANQVASNQVGKARDAALGAESARQRRLDQEAAAVNNRSRDRYQDFEGQEGASAKKLADFFNSQRVTGEQAATPAELPPSSSNIVTQETDKQLAKSKAFTDRQGEALGALRAFGETLGGISREQARDAGLVGQIGGFKRGSQGVLPYELQNAMGAGDGLKTFADIGQGLGSMFMMNGLMAPAAAAPAAAMPTGGIGLGTGNIGLTGTGALGLQANPATSGALRLGMLY